MKKIEKQKNIEKVITKKQETNSLGFAIAKENYMLLVIGFAIIMIGFLLMIGGGVDDPNLFYPDGDNTQTPEVFSWRRITLAPIIVLFGFTFEIWAIMKKPKALESAS